MLSSCGSIVSPKNANSKYAPIIPHGPARIEFRVVRAKSSMLMSIYSNAANIATKLAKFTR